MVRFLMASLSAGGRGRDLMASENLAPPTRPHPSSVERKSRGKWLQTAPQEPQEPSQEMSHVRFALGWIESSGLHPDEQVQDLVASA